MRHFEHQIADRAAANAVRAARAATLVGHLTDRQRQVLGGMLDGLRNKQIAAALGIDEKTVKMHRAGALCRLGAGTTAMAVRIGVEATFAPTQQPTQQGLPAPAVLQPGIHPA